jgi:outer membrane protein OmpA-like peptidoglycan-associated protein
VLAAVPLAKTNLATVAFEPNTTKVADASTEQLREVVRARQRNGGGTLHVVAFTELGPGRDLATRSIAGFNLALDRARAVGVALTQLGVPATSVSIGAGPPPADRQPGTADISLEN